MFETIEGAPFSPLNVIFVLTTSIFNKMEVLFVGFLKATETKLFNKMFSNSEKPAFGKIVSFAP